MELMLPHPVRISQKLQCLQTVNDRALNVNLNSQGAFCMLCVSMSSVIDFFICQFVIECQVE